MATLGDDHWIHVLFCCSDLQGKLALQITATKKNMYPMIITKSGHSISPTIDGESSLEMVDA